jgi:hypothetical protein
METHKIAFTQDGEFHRMGRNLYGDRWDTVRKTLCLLVTADRVSSSKDLTPDEKFRLIRTMWLAAELP